MLKRMKAIFIILLLLITFTSISTSPSQAPDAVQSTRLIDAVRVFSLNALQVKEMIAQAVNKLTAPRLKDKHDICVWKICSRPLKPAYKGPKAKAEIMNSKYFSMVIQGSKFNCTITAEYLLECFKKSSQMI